MLPIAALFRSRPLLHALLFCSAIAVVPAVPAKPRLDLKECRLESAAGNGSTPAKCGRYTVAENRDDARSKPLHLHVAVIPALRLKPAPEPLFILSGGPGQAASDFYMTVSPAFARIRRSRDIVLLDQRGTGRSNRLDCKFPDDDELAAVDPRQLQRYARDCLASLPGDPRFYTTSIAVRDLDEVREALGYERINLYGVSYGTRVAQHYIRRYPSRVRAAILDGVVPAELGLGPDVAIQAQRALDTLFDRCAGDALCQQRFSNLRQHFAELRAKVQREPLTVTVPHPVHAKPTLAVLGAPQLSAAVRLLSYTDETASTLPLLIHEAQVAQQPQALAAQYLMIKRNTDTQIAYGMHFAVVCSEDAPRWPSLDEAALARTYLGTSFMTGLKSVCDAWPRGAVDPDFGAAMRSDAPVLILSGGNDPVTPQDYGEQILPSFPNGKHLVLSGQGHGQIASGCMPYLAARFISTANVDKLNVSCLEHIVAAPFMLSHSGTAP